MTRLHVDIQCNVLPFLVEVLHQPQHRGGLARLARRMQDEILLAVNKFPYAGQARHGVYGVVSGWHTWPCGVEKTSHAAKVSRNAHNWGFYSPFDTPCFWSVFEKQCIGIDPVSDSGLYRRKSGEAVLKE
jgi:hypothetical protein